MFLDDKFGNIISNIGRRSVVPENVLSEKYHELAATFKANIHQVYNSLFAMEHDALLSLQQGEHNLEERIRSFHSRINEIHEQINQWAAETKAQLEQHAQTLEGNWVHALQQYSQNLDLTAKTMRTMLQQLTQDLIKNLLDVATKVISGAAAIIENIKQQGLLSFLPQ